MPAKKKPGISNINVRCEPWFADRVAEAAKQTKRSLSDYVRFALSEQIKRDGLSADAPPEIATEGSETFEQVKPRGRPRKPLPK